MQGLAVACLVAAVCIGQASASLYAADKCVVFNDIPNELVQCSGAHPVSACNGPNGCSSITDSKDCMSTVCCCSRSLGDSEKQSKTARRMAEVTPKPMLEMPEAPAAGPKPALPYGMKPLGMPMPEGGMPPAGCIANITYGSVWEENGGYLNSLNVVLTNLGPQTIHIPYTVVISKAGWEEVVQSWNWEAEVEKLNFVSGNFTYGAWQDLQAKGASSSYFGGIIKSTEPEFTPQDLTLNGVNCKITT